MASFWNVGNSLLRQVSPQLNFYRGKVIGVVSLKRWIRRFPSKNLMVKKIKNRRLAPGTGIYAGQISNFDTTHLDYFPITVPDIPLTPEGTDYKPTKLFAVWRICDLDGQPYWVREIMEEHLQLTEDIPMLHPAIVKNSPKTNQMLWHVKHMIRLKPIIFPDGFPTEEDLGSTFLDFNGQLRIRKHLKYTPEQLETVEEEKKMDPETLRKLLRLRWIKPWHLKPS